MHKKVCVVLFRVLEGQVHLLRLKTTPKRGEDWAHVTGSVEKGEKFAEGAKRELLEETGLDLAVHPSTFEHKFHDQFNRDVHEKIFWAVLDEDQTINLDGKEHTEYEWVPLSHVSEQTYSFNSHFQAFIHVLREARF